nr:MAG TPA: hypothetical protein [Caudoviricetes sp.]
MSQIVTPFFLSWNIFNVIIDLQLKIFYYGVDVFKLILRFCKRYLRILKPCI